MQIPVDALSCAHLHQINVCVLRHLTNTSVMSLHQNVAWTVFSCAEVTLELCCTASLMSHLFLLFMCVMVHAENFFIARSTCVPLLHKQYLPVLERTQTLVHLVNCELIEHACAVLQAIFSS